MQDRIHSREFDSAVVRPTRESCDNGTFDAKVELYNESMRNAYYVRFRAALEEEYGTSQLPTQTRDKLFSLMHKVMDGEDYYTKAEHYGELAELVLHTCVDGNGTSRPTV